MSDADQVTLIVLGIKRPLSLLNRVLKISMSLSNFRHMDFGKHKTPSSFDRR